MPIGFSPPFDLPLPPCPNCPSPLPFPFLCVGGGGAMKSNGYRARVYPRVAGIWPSHTSQAQAYGHVWVCVCGGGGAMKSNGYRARVYPRVAGIWPSHTSQAQAYGHVWVGVCVGGGGARPWARPPPAPPAQACGESSWGKKHAVVTP